MQVLIYLFSFFLMLLILESITAFSHQHHNDNLVATSTTTTTTPALKGRIMSRRIFVDMVAPLSIILVVQGKNTNNVASAAMENSQKVFVAGKELTTEQAKERILKGQESLVYLIDHFEEIADGGGDNVRRYLGTVGTTSGMYGISKAMKQLQNEADDIVEYTETMNEVNSAIAGAE